MEALGFVLRKDGLGFWKVESYTSFDGYGFTLDSGERIATAKAYVCDPRNLEAAAKNWKMTEPSGMMLPDLDAKQIAEHLATMSCQLDSDWRIRHAMGAPFMKLKATNIGPMIKVHEAVCMKDKKNPEDVLCAVAHVGTGPEPEKHEMFAYLMKDGTGVPLPDGKDMKDVSSQFDEGEIHLVVDRMGFKRIVFKLGDWYAYPKSQWKEAPVCVFTVMKYMPGTQNTSADSVAELVGPDKFVTTEGNLLAKGGKAMDWNIDDILKGPDGA